MYTMVYTRVHSAPLGSTYTPRTTTLRRQMHFGICPLDDCALDLQVP